MTEINGSKNNDFAEDFAADDEGTWSPSGDGGRATGAEKNSWTVNTNENDYFLNIQAFNESIVSDYILCPDQNCEACLQQKAVSKPIKLSSKVKKKLEEQEKQLREKRQKLKEEEEKLKEEKEKLKVEEKKLEYEEQSSDKQKLSQKIQRPGVKILTTPPRATEKIKIKPAEKPQNVEEEIKYICSTCDVKIFQKGYVKIHLNGDQHKKKLQDLKEKLNSQPKGEIEDIDIPIGVEVVNEKFICKVCQVVTAGVEDLTLHLENLDHLQKLGTMYIDSEPLDRVDNLPHGIKSTRISNVFYCAICPLTIKNYANIKFHVSHKSHEICLKVWLGIFKKAKRKTYTTKDKAAFVQKTTDFPEEIKTDGRDYWCKACCCFIKKSFHDEIVDTVAKVWQHINGKMHRAHLKCKQRNEKFYKTNVLRKEKIKSPVVKYVSPLELEELYDVRVENSVIVSAGCKSCQINFYGKTGDVVEDWNEHLATQGHLKREKIYSEKIIAQKNEAVQGIN